MSVSAQAKPKTLRPSHPDALCYGVMDVAGILGVSRNTVWRLVADGKLHPFKIGARTLIVRRELEVLISRRQPAA